MWFCRYAVSLSLSQQKMQNLSSARSVLWLIEHIYILMKIPSSTEHQVKSKNAAHHQIRLRLVQP